MLRSTIRTRTTRFLVVAGALLALTAGGAYATGVLGSPVGADGVIHGCYQKFNGTLRLVAAANPACRTSEQQIAWSQTGPKGEQGVQGDKGDPGAQGRPGRARHRRREGRERLSGSQSSRISPSPRPPGGRSLELRRREVVVGGGAWLFTNPGVFDDSRRALIRARRSTTPPGRSRSTTSALRAAGTTGLQVICASAS